MILEVAMLHIKPDLADQFEDAFRTASSLISNIEGYIDHQLQKCLEEDYKYLLLVQWETVEAHEIGFRTSAAYIEWKKLLHHFYDPFPIVEHYRNVQL